MHPNKRPRRTTASSVSMHLIGIPKRFHYASIDDFNTYGNENLEEIKSFFDDYIENIQDMYRLQKGLIVIGSNGVGKTMLTSIVAKEAYMNRFSVKRCSFSDYINAYTNAWNSRYDEKEVAEERFYSEYKSVHFLVLDEVGKEVSSKISMPILEDCLRYREELGYVTIICSNLNVSALEERYGTSILSLMKGTMIPLQIESEDKREEVFKKGSKLYE